MAFCSEIKRYGISARCGIIRTHWCELQQLFNAVAGGTSLDCVYNSVAYIANESSERLLYQDLRISVASERFRDSEDETGAPTKARGLMLTRADVPLIR